MGVLHYTGVSKGEHLSNELKPLILGYTHYIIFDLTPVPFHDTIIL